MSSLREPPPDAYDDPVTRASNPAKRASRLALRAVLPLLLLAAAWYWLLRHADLSSLASSLRAVPAAGWLAAALALVGGHALRALRLQQEWKHVRHADFGACLRLVLLHNAAVLLLPLRSGEAGYLWLVQREFGVGWRESAPRLLWWRVQDAAVLLALSAMLLLPWPLAARILLVASTFGMILPFVPRSNSWLGLGASAGNWTLKVLANGSLLMLLAGYDLATCLRSALGGEIAGVLPVQGPAGLGTYEAGAWVASHLASAAQPAFVAAMLAVHAFSLAVALGAAAIALWRDRVAAARSSLQVA
jgi:hypothetical protein